MKYLIFADLHTFNPDNLDLITEEPDIIILLGDIKASSIYKILMYFPDKPCYGVLGNHDDESLFVSVNQYLKASPLYSTQIIDINLKKIEDYGLSFTGIQGSNKYKDDMVGYTQEESQVLYIPEADILFSHDTGYRYMGREDEPHIGLKGISNYIEHIQPKYNIFGHYHMNQTFTKENTTCICVYGCALFNDENGEMKIYFED